MHIKRTFLALLLAVSVIGIKAQTNAYEWRGCMLDVSRHFFSADFLKKQVDVLSAYGINRFHLHLVDAGGWRLEIKQYPRLTEVGAWRTKQGWEEWWEAGDRQYASASTAGAYGGFYTQAQMRELVAYAAERGVEIVPEIEMPGHSAEVMAAYPELACNGNYHGQSDLCVSNPATIEFLQNVLREVMDIFPSAYIHIGGDEADMVEWSKCSLCSAEKERLGLKNNKELQDHFIRRMMQYVVDQGRKPIGWDDALCDNLPKGSVIMLWRGADKAREIVEKGYDLILTPSNYCYLDYYQDCPPCEPYAFGTYLPIEQTYRLTEALIPSNHLLGVQGNLWTELIETPEHVEYMLYPRMLAIAEIGQKGIEAPAFNIFREQAVREANRLREAGVNAFNLGHEKGHRPESKINVQHRGIGAKVEYIKPMHPAYSAAGETSLVDGKRGDWNHNDHRWQGFSGDSCLDIIIDLQHKQRISSVKMDFMQSDVAWIYLPKHLTISFSKDGKKFTEVWNRTQEKIHHRQLWFENWGWDGRQRTRYIRIQGSATSPDDWLFLDEVVIN